MRGAVFTLLGYSSQITGCYARLIPTNVCNPVVLIDRQQRILNKGKVILVSLELTVTSKLIHRCYTA
jgi:hypothetical protein